MHPLLSLLRFCGALLVASASLASAQTIIADSFTDISTTNALWSKNLDYIPDGASDPELTQSEGAGTLTFSYRPTIFSNVDLPSDHRGSISFEFGFGGGDVLSVGLRGSSARDSTPYGSFYGLVLEFHQYLGQLRVVDFNAAGSATVLGSYALSFDSGTTYNFSWLLDSSDLTVNQVGGGAYDFTGLTPGAGNKIFINNGQNNSDFVLYDVSVAAIPEPGTYAALAGLVAASAAFYRRARRVSPAAAGEDTAAATLQA